MAEHILVVDDEPDLEHVINQQFRQEIKKGIYVFFFAQNGKQALKLLQSNPNISIIITDINMPEMSGLELLQNVNEMQNPCLKVVIISAYGDMKNIRFAMNNGAFDFLVKPVELNDLVTTIEKTVIAVNIIKTGLGANKQLKEVNNELLAAREIQQAILPKIYPPFPNIKQFDVYGQMQAAESVGGDFYDFFLIDETHLGFVVGDVSGKGVPAAIFMAVTRTLINSLGKIGLSTNECLEQVNKILSEESVNAMFVTVFYGILNIKTGEIRYTNAGHNYPYIIKTDANVEQLSSETNSTVIGVFENISFTEHTVQLKPNESIFVYTDGINEAMDENEEQLGIDTVETFLNTFPLKNNPQAMIKGIFDLVKNYTINTKQSDDVTALVVTYFGE